MTQLALILVALGGCMRIYPDPELPDITLEMNADCEAGTEIILNLVAVDDGTVTQQILPCSFSERITLEDVARKLYRIDGATLDADGTIIATASTEADLRNGFNEEAYLYFDRSNLRLGWDFDMSATCASLDVDTVAVDFGIVDQGFSFTIELSCDFGVFIGAPYGQMVTVQLRGISRRKTIAASPITPVTLDFEEITDLGTLTLTPCGNDCPSSPNPF